MSLDLQQAGELLEKTSQTDAGAKSASTAVAKAVISKSILDHKDKASIECNTAFAHSSMSNSRCGLQDVRGCAAYCLSHILKLHAPESPYSTTQLQVHIRPCLKFADQSSLQMSTSVFIVLI